MVRVIGRMLLLAGWDWSGETLLVRLLCRAVTLGGGKAIAALAVGLAAALCVMPALAYPIPALLKINTEIDTAQTPRVTMPSFA
ncbi:MAG: hypothetical protein AAFY13_13600, partial [Pseudomonadota bacterium]